MFEQNFYRPIFIEPFHLRSAKLPSEPLEEARPAEPPSYCVALFSKVFSFERLNFSLYLAKKARRRQDSRRPFAVLASGKFVVPGERSTGSAGQASSWAARNFKIFSSPGEKCSERRENGLGASSGAHLAAAIPARLSYFLQTLFLGCKLLLSI